MSVKHKLGLRGHRPGLEAALRGPVSGPDRAARSIERILREQFWLAPARRPSSALRTLHARAAPAEAETAAVSKPEIP